jgi:GT2 family glycosyltransferase
MKKTVEIIIITYNSKAIIGNCIDSLFSSIDMKMALTVVDNASSDGTVKFIEQQYPSVKIIKNIENMGYAKAVNIGAKSVKGEFFVISNADVVFHNTAVSQMVSYLNAHDKVGVIGVQQIFPDGRWQRSYGLVPGILDSLSNLMGITLIHNWRRRLSWPRKVDINPKQVAYIDGAVIAVRKKAFESVSGFDEDFFFYAEEADFCLRLRRNGWKSVFLPSGRITHIRGGSSTKVDSATDKYIRLQVNSKLLLVGKHYPQWQVPLYIFLEKAHAKKMKLMYQTFRLFTPASKSEHFYNMILYFNLLYKVWDEKAGQEKNLK